MRQARGPLPDRHHVRSWRCRTRLAGDVPRLRHAPGGAELLRRRGTRNRPGRHVRARRPGRRRCAGVAVQSGGIGIALANHLTRLGIGVSSFASMGEQVRRLGQRPPRLVGTGPAHGAGDLVPGVVRQPAQVRQDCQAARPADARPHGGRRPVAGRPARRRLAHRGGRDAAGHAGGAVRAGRIIAAENLGELIDTAAFLSCQPYPAGRASPW